jgi:flagellar assembly factor FliW
LPVLAIDSGFRLELSDDEKSAILFPPDFCPEIGVDVLCLGLLMPADGTVRTNLSAPVVINLHNCRGVQCVPEDSSRSCFQLGENGRWEILC